MGGIAGALVFDHSSFKISGPYLKQMQAPIVHRGPGAPGFWISDDKKTGLVQIGRAVSGIADALLPSSSADGRLWIACDGEIYNRATIAEEIEKTGNSSFPDGCPAAEVILRSYEQWGAGCLEKFRGAYAFALWDAGKKELWLVRDPVGVKPLYYSVHHGRITFASEIKALLQDPEQVREVDELALYHYLSFLISPAPQTLFKGIKKLPCGTQLRVSADGSMVEQRYWDVWDQTGPLSNLSEKEICQLILEELREAALLQKPAANPVGVFLSGGLDSSILTALLSEDQGSPVKTFTIGYQGDYRSYCNEFSYARLIAAERGTEHHEYFLDHDELLSFIPRMIYLQDEPIADPVCAPTYYLSKMAAENNAVCCHVGEGADELFWGYPSWKTAYRLEKLNSWPLPRSLKTAGLHGLRMLGRDRTCYYEWLRRGTAGLPVYWSMEAYTDLQKQVLLSPRLRRKFRHHSAWEALQPVYKRFEEKAWEKSHLNWMTYLDLNLRLPELLLMRLDKMTAAVGVEARAPFLDHRFVAQVLSIPEKIKVRNGQLKYILKKAARGLLPDMLIDRKKQGLAVPVTEWFYDYLDPVIRRAMTELDQHTDFFDRTEVERIMEEGRGQKAWYLMNFALWWREYIK